ncbi:MAG: adenylate cyclase [Fusobacteriaceae bacterium]|nr:adenylate cyclase [Fusobacteriaceae bacterium]
MIRKNIIKSGFFILTFMILLYVIYTNLGMTFFEIFELKTYDMRYKAMDIFEKKDREYDVVIAGIDEKSLIEIGKWPWERSVHGELVKVLTEYGVKSIGFDVSFTEEGVSKDKINYKKNMKTIVATKYKQGVIPEKDAIELLKEINKLDTDQDYEFAAALKESGNTVIGTYNIMDKTEDLTNFQYNPVYYQKSRFYKVSGILDEILEVGRTGERRVKPFEIYKIIPPIDIIAKFAYGIAPYDVGTPDIDGVLRGIVTVTKENSSNLYFPPLYLLVYLKSENLDIKKDVVLDLKNSKIDIFKEGKLYKNIPTNINGYQRLFFYGKGHTFKYIPYTDIINKRIDKKELENKIVLVGYTDSAKGLYDLRVTPLDPNTPGVELHATAIQNLIDYKFMKRMEIKGQAPLLFLFGSLIIIILSIKDLNLVISNILTNSVILIYLFLSYILFLKGIWIEVFYPIVIFILIYLALTIENYFLEGKEKKYIRNVFGHYISPVLVEELVKKPEMLKLGGEKRELTAFFSDIQGFTSISEKMSPEELVEFLNDYLSVSTNIILEYKGTIDKYIGDAVMAIFGAPIQLENNALNACFAALEYQDKLVEFREKYKDSGYPPIYARIGINSGEMVVGNMGCNIGENKKFNYTIIGDEVNLASRLEGANKMYGTYIMISENTYKKVKEDIEARVLDLVRVKGKKIAVKTYELMARKGELSKEKLKLKEIYEKGLDFYFNKEWEKAKEMFLKALEIDENDGPSKLYINRIEEYIKNPPPQDWDGVYTFTTK